MPDRDERDGVVRAVGRERLVQEEERREREVRESDERGPRPERPARDEGGAARDREGEAHHRARVRRAGRPEHREHRGHAVRLEGARVGRAVVEDGMAAPLEDVARHEADDRLVGAPGNPRRGEESELDREGQQKQEPGG